ncbi:hypothetical protein Peur_031760 [Populus x canadensis]
MGSAMPAQQQQQQPPQEASYEQPNGGPNGDGNGTILDTMAQGFVAVAPQQVGQMVVQSVINPDADGDSTGSNNNRDPNGGANNYCNPSPPRNDQRTQRIDQENDPAALSRTTEEISVLKEDPPPLSSNVSFILTFPQGRDLLLRRLVTATAMKANFPLKQTIKSRVQEINKWL